MEASRKAVEAYRKTLLIDRVITDDDKIASVYRLDEICDTFRTSSFDVVQEVLDYILKRLRHKSPRVKQKILRVIKYTAGKCGPEYKRELQGKAETIRQLFHYKGQTDPLRGDALNKAVRDTAHEALNSIFASDEKSSILVDSSKRIQGFGSSYSDSKVTQKKSLLDEMLGFGTASIKQGLTMISSYSNNGNGRSQIDLGNYKEPTLRRSLTSEQELNDQHFKNDFDDSRDSLRLINKRPQASLNELEISQAGLKNGEPAMHDQKVLSQEDKLLESVTISGGVRLQPTRESLQIFVVNALKLDPVNMGHSLESKLQTHSWQVRLKALCALEAILRQKDQHFCSTIAMMFEEDASTIYECAESPQASLREKAKKVLDLLGVSKQLELCTEKPVNNTAVTPMVEVPDLLDTSESNILGDAGTQLDVLPSKVDNTNADTPAFTKERYFFGDMLVNDRLDIVHDSIVDDDPFAGVSFHAPEGTVKDATGCLFLGLSIGTDKVDVNGSVNIDSSLDGFNASESTDDVAIQSSGAAESFLDLIGGPSNNNATMLSGGSGSIPSLSKAPLLRIPEQENHLSAQMLGNIHSSQVMHLNPSLMLPMGAVPNFQLNLLQQSFIPTTMVLGNMSDAFSQQNFMSGMTSFQAFSMGRGLGITGSLQGGIMDNRGLSTAFPDGFDFSIDATSRYMEVEDNIKKEETKAFDFISEHVSTVRGLKRATQLRCDHFAA